MILKTETVAKTIKGWSILYPSAQRSQEREAFISKEFYAELRGVYSDEAFKLAARKVKRHCKFFPTIADMYSVKDEVINEINRDKQIEQNKKALPEYTEDNTPAEKENAAKRLSLIGMAINGEITYQEAERQMQEMIGYAQS